MTNKEVFNSDLVDFLALCPLNEETLCRTVVQPEGLQSIYRQKLLIVESLLHRLSVLLIAKPGVGQDFWDRDSALRVHKKHAPDKVF